MSARPEPTFRWHRRNDEILLGERFEQKQSSNIIVDSYTSTLIISGVTEQDMGEYVCNVSNSLGEERLTIRLQTKSEQSFLSSKCLKSAEKSSSSLSNCIWQY